MKEPFLVLAGVTALVTSAEIAGKDVSAERIAALLAAGITCGCYSLWKSRKRRATKADAALWAVIEMLGSMSLGWFAAPMLAGREVMGLVLPDAAFMTWLIAMGGAPFVVWLLDRRAFNLVMRIVAASWPGVQPAQHKGGGDDNDAR